MAGAVPLAVFQALWEGLPCTGVLPVTTTSSTKTVTTTRGLLQGVSDCIDHHVLLCTGQDQGIAQGQGLPEAAVLGLPVVSMACRVQHQHPHYHGGDGMGAFGSMDDEEEEVRRRMSAGPMVAWAMQTLWGKGVAVRIDARARDRARDRDRAGDRADWGELVMEIRCADEHTLAAILAGMYVQLRFPSSFLLPSSLFLSTTDKLIITNPVIRLNYLSNNACVSCLLVCLFI